MIAGAYIFGLGARSYLQVRALLREGVAIEAELVDAGTRDGDDDGHWIRYRFHVGSREYHRRSASGHETVNSFVSARDQARTVETGRVPVRYLASDPAVNEPVAQLTFRRAQVMGAAGAAAFILGAVRLVLAWRSKWRRAGVSA